jgi:hypothetical protein
MRLQSMLLPVAITLALPGQAAVQAVAESVKPQSAVSVLVEPKLSDGRLILKLAAKNLGKSAVAFGPSAISIAKPNGEVVAVYPLQSLIEDVRAAAGTSPADNPPTQGAYAAPQLSISPIRAGGQVDVTGYTGGAAVGTDEYRRSRAKRTNPSITEAEAQAQIAALKQAILQDTTLAPGRVIAAEVVSAKLKFAKGEERILHVRVRIAGDDHSFTVAVPQS